MSSQTGEAADLIERQALAYRDARTRLRKLHGRLARQRETWSLSSQPCSAARAVAYQSAMSEVSALLDAIEAIANETTNGATDKASS